MGHDQTARNISVPNLPDSRRVPASQAQAERGVSTRPSAETALVTRRRFTPATQSRDVSDFIEQHLTLASVPLIPEIVLHMATPTSGLSQLTRPAHWPAPYWAYCWAGGLALARHILDTPTLVSGRRVLDLGTGSGLVGIAAAKAGATHVIASDIDPHALIAVGLNAVANHVDVHTEARDLMPLRTPNVDLVLVGDLFYTSDLGERVIAFLDRCHDTGLSVLIGDPGRTGLPLARLDPVAAYRVFESNRNEARARLSHVFRLR